MCQHLSDDRVQHCTTQIIHLRWLQAYTDCLNDSSRHIDLCACTRSELVQWDHRLQTDVSECWSKRWVVWWALSDNLQETKIILLFWKWVFITECFLSNEEKLLFVKDTECHSQNLFVQNWFSIHDSTMTEHSKRDVTDALLSWQFFWLRCYRMSVHSAEIVTNAANSWKDCWQGFLKPLPVLKQIWQRYSLTL
jgi:hypothetical protein